jgi:hypothetical protein
MEPVHRILSDFISLIHKSKHKDPNSNLEFEIRFSTFLKNDIFKNAMVKKNTTPPEYRFVPVVTKTDFHRILNIFKTFNLETEFVDSVDYFYSDQNEKRFNNDIRKTTMNNEIFFIKKEKIKIYDMFPLNMRLCLSNEKVTFNVP